VKKMSKKASKKRTKKWTNIIFTNNIVMTLNGENIDDDDAKAKMRKS
jgi:hypothetical protein